MTFPVRMRNIRRILRNLFYCVVRDKSFALAFLCDLEVKDFPKSTLFVHPFGVVVRKDTIIGERCIISQSVTIGQRRNGHEKCARIGNNVKIGANAIILGGVVIGDRAVIGAGAIVLKDVPANAVIVGVYK